MRKGGVDAQEKAVAFPCRGEELAAILHPASGTRGVLVVVGGPQYRVGSHRQFVLLARYLATQGIPVMRFDYRGMGDSSGELRDFQAVEEDIRAAIDVFVERLPYVEELIIWGLCDAASAAAYYAFQDRRVTGLVLLNPWVRTEAGEAKAYLRHYYRQRLTDAQFWRLVFSLRWNPLASLNSVVNIVLRAAQRSQQGGRESDWRERPLPERMLYGLSHFDGAVLLVLSGRDLTAAEFKDLVSGSPSWQAWESNPSVTLKELPESDHTFSRTSWRDQVAEWTFAWLRSW